MTLPNYFTPKELECKHCGADGTTAIGLYKMNVLRSLVEEPLTLTSAYRCQNHPEEVAKDRPGQHCVGNAFDIKCDGPLRLKIIAFAAQAGFNTMGFAESFIHLDDRARPTSWVY